jgi:hypothetical protein
VEKGARIRSNSGELRNENIAINNQKVNSLIARPLEENSTFLISIDPLETEMRLFEGLTVVTEPVKIEKTNKRRISFGAVLSIGKVHASTHQTPFVSPSPTRIEGGKSYGYGFFGNVYLDSRSSIRPSFTYVKNTHLHFVEGLRFASGVTDLNLELHSHELKFGLDYAFNLIPNFNLFDVKAGLGVAYHKTISLESNNYFTNLEFEVKNLNELNISPLSYKLFLGFEIPVYKGLLVGLEPYIIYQKRKARYTRSLFIADQGYYNLMTGLNMTVRF